MEAGVIDRAKDPTPPAGDSAVKIALVQQHASPEVQANRERGLDALERAAAAGAQVICYAELAFNPFYPQEPGGDNVADLAESVPGPTTEMFAHTARELGVVVVLNVFELDGERTFDSSPVIDADGTVLGKTRMTHIPDYACFHERSYYTPGDTGAPVYETAHGKIGVAICYDRHYPEYMRQLALAGAELVVVPQAGAVDEWPDGLFEAEMRVASFHHGYFTALCNRVGKEKKLTFAGESFVTSPAGIVVARAARGKDETLICDVDLREVQASNARKLFLQDRRPELYRKWLDD